MIPPNYWRCRFFFDSRAAAVSLLLVLSIAVYLVLIAFGSGPYISDDHPFRQTQTALGAASIGALSDILRYEVPVLGPPWHLVYEFPTYQVLVAGISAATGLPFVATGRLVSVLFFLLTLLPLYRLLGVFGIHHRSAALALILFSPLYVFWSRSFMIETTALFFSVAYLAELVRVYRQERVSLVDVLSIAFFGSFAVLTKATTVAPWLMLAAVAIVWGFVRSIVMLRSWPWKWILIGAAHAVILGVALVWRDYADAITGLSPQGELLTSANQTHWIFGTLEQRLDPHTWFRIANTTVDMFAPFPAGLAVVKGAIAVALATVFLICFWLSSVRSRWVAVALIALYFLPFAVFTNLQASHNYYQVANGWLFFAALGVLFDDAYRGSGERARCLIAPLHVGVLVVFLGCALWYFHFKSSFEPYDKASLADAIRSSTPQGSVILVTGEAWRTPLAYFSQRRAVMRIGNTEQWRRALTMTEEQGFEIRAYVACGDGRIDPVVAEKYGVSGEGRWIDDCRLFVLPERSSD